MRSWDSASEASVDELVPIAYADTSKLAWPLARLAVEAHLIKLEREGHVVRRGDAWLSVSERRPSGAERR